MNRCLAVVMVSGLLVTGCPKGYEFHRVPGEQRVVSVADVESLALDARNHCAEAVPKVHCEKHPEWCQRDGFEPPSDGAVCGPHLKTTLSFVHLSDAQLKEHQISIRGPMGEGGYDHLTPGSARNPELERDDFAVLLATVLGVNSLVAHGGTQQPDIYAPCPAPIAPAFVIHTGDAVDAGMFSEFFEFLSIMKALEIPFYNAVGNHDNLFFGTFPKQTMSGLDVTLPFVPIGDTRQFLEAHNPDAAKRDYSVPYLPGLDHGPTNQVGGCEEDTEEGTALSQYPQICQASTHHGFDLFCPEPRSGAGRAASLCLDARGYYAQDVVLPAMGKLPRRRVRLLVLNTSENFPQTTDEALKSKSRGKMSDRQLMWLDNELSGSREMPTIFLVAAHHTLDSFMPVQENLLRDLLLSEPRVAAYLSGHTHRSALRRYKRSQGSPLHEITSGSTLVYPQLGNLIDLLEDTEKDGVYLRVRSFRQGLTDQVKSTCRLKRLAERGRDGAKRDKNDNAWTNEDESARHSNSLFRVAGFKKEK
jgi:Calcineurin-like phosphoesterase